MFVCVKECKKVDDSRLDFDVQLRILTYLNGFGRFVELKNF